MFDGYGTNMQAMTVIKNARLFAIAKSPIAVCPFSSVNDRLIDKGLETVHDVVVRWRVLRKK
jgi:dTDP-glucose pyrophosphorylase